MDVTNHFAFNALYPFVLFVPEGEQAVITLENHLSFEISLPRCCESI
jgi:hypothetical protein